MLIWNANIELLTEVEVSNMIYVASASERHIYALLYEAKPSSIMMCFVRGEAEFKTRCYLSLLRLIVILYGETTHKT